MGYFLAIFLNFVFCSCSPLPPKNKFRRGQILDRPLACMVLIIFENVAVIQVYYQYNVLQLDLLISLLHCVHIDYEVTANTKWRTAANEIPVSY